MRRVFAYAVCALSACLLLTMGGAIFAAPFTVPALFVIGHRVPTRAGRVAVGLLAAATLAEVAWALTYVSIGEAKPWTWLTPTFVATLTLVWVVSFGPRPGGTNDTTRRGQTTIGTSA